MGRVIKRAPCVREGCSRTPNRGMTICSPCVTALKRQCYPDLSHIEMFHALNALSKERVLTHDESFLLELSMRQLAALEHDAVRRPAKRPRGRPHGSVNGEVGAPIDSQREDRITARRIERASQTLLRKMLAVGAKQGGCLDLSAAQCRARLESAA